MSTRKYELNTDWQIIVAGEDDNFIADNISNYNMEVTFQSYPPGELTPYHILPARGGMMRLGVSGSLYARCTNNATLIVSSS